MVVTVSLNNDGVDGAGGDRDGPGCGSHFVEGHGVDVEGSKDRLLVRHAWVVHVGDLRRKDLWRTFSSLLDYTSIEITQGGLKWIDFSSNPRKIVSITSNHNGQNLRTRQNMHIPKVIEPNFSF